MRTIRSMTGFGAGMAADEEMKVTAEIKAVNQRFLDLTFHMENRWNYLEDAFRKRVKQSVARGKVDVYFTTERIGGDQAFVKVDRDLALACQRALEELSDTLHLARPDDLAQIAAYPGVLSLAEPPAGRHEEQLAEQALQEALSGLEKMRRAEGENLARDFLHRLDILSGLVGKLKEIAPGIVSAYRSHLQQVVEKLLSAAEIDERLIIEQTAVFADKVDFTEEIVRLESHFRQFREILSAADEPVGRKLDFLIQEMNREANTIGSKCNDAAAASVVVEMKSEIEKLREQVQNIE